MSEGSASGCGVGLPSSARGPQARAGFFRVLGSRWLVFIYLFRRGVVALYIGVIARGLDGLRGLVFVLVIDVGFPGWY